MQKQYKSIRLLTLASLLLFGFSQSMASERYYKNGQEAYTKVCAYCHDTGVGPDSIKIKFDAASVDFRTENIFQTVRLGLNAMPAFRKTEIDDATLRDLSRGLATGTIK
ncbi:MAG: mono/diheme cytochrome c family protein [Sulfurimonas sp.]|jgi:mono/diheme cytochrome c family protein|uniref:c-type cytochrome n=1 Tax=Sulfurimonas sp. TaxID=2022749 RepID=UPI0039E4E7E6